LLAGMNADTSQNPRKRHFFSDNSVGLICFAPGDHPQIPGDIYVSRTGGFTRHNILFPCRGFHPFIHQGPGGADLHTGRTKFTSGGLQCFRPAANLNPAVFIIYKTDGLDPPEVTAGTDTSRTADAKIIIPFK